MTTLTVWSTFLVALVAINITVREFLRCGKRFFLGGGLRFFRRCRLLFGRDQHNLSSSGLNLLLRGFSSNNNLGTLARHGELAFERSGTKGAHGGQCGGVAISTRGSERRVLLEARGTGRGGGSRSGRVILSRTRCLIRRIRNGDKDL